MFVCLFGVFFFHLLSSESDLNFVCFRLSLRQHFMCIDSNRFFSMLTVVEFYTQFHFFRDTFHYIPFHSISRVSFAFEFRPMNQQKLGHFFQLLLCNSTWTENYTWQFICFLNPTRKTTSNHIFMTRKCYQVIKVTIASHEPIVQSNHQKRADTCLSSSLNAWRRFICLIYNNL